MKYFTLLLLFLSVGSEASTAWWEMCDSCQTETQFVESARNASGEHEIVYVSNRVTNTTRKFNRFFTVEDIDGGYVYMTHVYSAEFPEFEEQVFENTIASAQTIFAPVDRDFLSSHAAIGDASSVITDIQAGFVPQSIVSAVSLWMEHAGHLPSRENVNEQLGLDFFDFGFLTGQSEELRTKILTVRINYPDGSYLQFRRLPDGTLDSWNAQDAQGEPITFIGTAVHPDSLGMRSPYNFGPGDPELGQALLNLYHSLNMTRWVCTMEDVGGGVVRLSCSRR